MQKTTTESRKLLNQKYFPSSKVDTSRSKFPSFAVYGLLYIIIVASVVFNGIMYVQMENFKGVLNSLQPAGVNHQNAPEPPPAERDAQICVPCSLLAYNSTGAKYPLQNLPEERTAQENCCVDATEGHVVGELIRKGVEGQLQREKIRGEFGAVKHEIIHQKDGRNFTSWDNKPAAHLLGCVREQVHVGGPYEPQAIRRWLIPGDHRKTVLKNGLKYRDGRIIISTEGLYYVYSQVLFIESYVASSEEQTEQDKFKHRCHYIHRYNINDGYNREDELLRGKATKCWSKYKEVGEHTSYLGGVFHLRPGDELFVKVSNISEVSRLALSNNFGVYML